MLPLIIQCKGYSTIIAFNKFGFRMIPCTRSIEPPNMSNQQAISSRGYVFLNPMISTILLVKTATIVQMSKIQPLTNFARQQALKSKSKRPLDNNKRKDSLCKDINLAPF